VPLPVPPERRALLVTADAGVLDEVLRLAAAAGVELHVAPDLGAARLRWGGAALVLVGDDAAVGAVRRLPRRDGVVLLGRDLDDAGVWERGVAVGAEHVVFLPDAEGWLVSRLAEAACPPAAVAPLVAVVGGRGGAGATTLATALAVTAARTGRSAVLVDADPLGGGLDLVLGGEHESGLRWPDLVRTRGRVPAEALTAALPLLEGVRVLSWDRGDVLAVPTEAVDAVLVAARRASALVVVDLPRALDEGTRVVLERASTVLLVVPTEVRAAAAASRVATGIAPLCQDVRLVVRGPSPSGLGADGVATALSLPVLGELRPEPALGLALERGEAPARRGRGPLFQLCSRLVEELVPPLRAAA
jgi:secretion/DNA translocation related CpaE-like protein